MVPQSVSVENDPDVDLWALSARAAPRGSMSHRVPFRLGTFLLKFFKLAPVVDGDEQFPDQQQGQAQ